MKDSSPSYAEDTSKLTLWASKCDSFLFVHPYSIAKLTKYNTRENT